MTRRATSGRLGVVTCAYKELRQAGCAIGGECGTAIGNDRRAARQYRRCVVTRQLHRAAVERLRASYAALAPGGPVRLAKPTTNLFRPRQAVAAPGLDVTGLTGVISVDREARTAEVQGMCTYEDLVDATLPHGLIPYVVPQLRTITLGGAVSGLGIESTSFRHGLPHESVLEMDVFTGAGDVVTTRPGDDLFDAFPNSYGSLGYATRLSIRLEEVPGHVALRHLRFDDEDHLASAVAELVATGSHDGVRVDALDGVTFRPGESYLTLATWTDESGPTSDYTGQRIYYRSLQERTTDRLTMHDYLWRWDTDWFWCSRAFGAQHPVARRIWPRRWRRSDVYMRLLGLDRRFGIADRLDRRAGRPQRERVVQDVEVPVERLAEFLAWFDAEVGMQPVWLCPVVATRSWPTYPLEPGRCYVNVGFWGTVHVGPEAGDAPRNRAIEAVVHELGGHKSLYSDSFYDRDTFDALYDGAGLARVKKLYDPEDRLTGLYDKAVGRR
jgi:FAD/FMN-containing dehydrogenase